LRKFTFSQNNLCNEVWWFQLILNFQNFVIDRVTKGRYNPILSPLLRVVEQAEVLPEFLETSGDIRSFVIPLLWYQFEHNQHKDCRGIVQWLGCLTFSPAVPGSNPSGGIYFKKSTNFLYHLRFPKILAINLVSTAAILLLSAKGIHSAL